jgi:hypothetical protein
MNTTLRSTVRRLREAAALFDDQEAPEFAPPASPAELRALAAATRVAPSDDFIQLLSLHRAIIAMEVHNGYWLGGSASGRVALAEGPGSATFGGARLTAFPVASDGGGNLFLRPRTMSSIWRWNHETGVTHRVAKSFVEFLGLVAEDWEHAARGDQTRLYLVSSARYRQRDR